MVSMEQITFRLQFYQGKEFFPRFLLRAEASKHVGSNCFGTWFLYATHGHTKVCRFYDHGYPMRFDGLLNGSGNLLCQALLYL